MRNTFAKLLLEEMRQDDRIYLLFADVGFGVFDEIRKEFPDRAINTGAAEQLMIGAAVGLAQEGKIPFCYTISPFLLYRPFEWIRNYVNFENLNIKLIGSGRDKDYDKDGFTHWAEEDHIVMKLFPNIKCHFPTTKETLYFTIQEMVKTDKPYYLNLPRKV